MIAGELEGLYDNFQLFGKKKNKSSGPKKTIKQRLQNLAGKIDKAGGVEAMGKTADNLLSHIKPKEPGQAPPSDYEINMKALEDKEEKAKKKKKLIITGAVIAGAVILTVVLIRVSINKKSA